MAKMKAALMTKVQWKRLAGLRERLRIRDEQQAKALEECCAIPWTHGDDELRAYAERDRRHLIGAEYASKFLRIPLPALLRATAGQPFALDFGRSWNGKRLRFFRSVELQRFAARQARGASTGGTRLALVQAA